MEAVANLEMARAWDGEEGDQWTEYAERYEAAGVHLWARFVKAVPIGPSERIVDIGCGTGKSTRDVARLATDGYVLGVDLSSRMLGYARERCRAERLANVEFVHGDAQVHPFATASFDLAISDFGTMFFNDQVAAFRNIGGALRSGGRLAMLTWQELEKNAWLKEIRGALAVGRDLPAPPTGAPGPFGLADAGQVRDILERAGFVDVELEPVDEPMRFGSDADDAWEFFSVMGIVKGLTHDLDDAMRDEAFRRLRSAIEGHAGADGVLFDSAAWLTTARRA